MFKLIRILNSGTNQPEPIRLPAQVNKTHYKGKLMKLVSGILMDITTTETPTHIVMEKKTAKPNDQTVLCYAVTPDMIFETESCEEPSSDMIGMKVDLFTDGTNMVGVSNYEGSAATVYDLMGAKKSGDHVLRRFI